MSEYGSDKAVENMQFCMPSMQKRNFDMMNKESKYPAWNDASDTKAWPNAMQGEKSRKQVMK